MEDTIIDALLGDLKTKEQKREQGRRRALEISIAKQVAAGSNNAENIRKNRKSDRHGSRNQHRHKHFARWILQKFPDIVDDTNNFHVLDIAGGKGELSARLALCHSLRVVMIDPRPADLSYVYLNSVVPKLPKKWQNSLEERLRHTPTFVEDEIRNRFSQIVTHFSISPHKNNSCNNGGNDDDSTKERNLFEDEAVENAVQNAALIIGLHADGATEAIVDAAIHYNKPFVIVPCCVFPNLFNDRFIYLDDDSNTSCGEEMKKRVAVRTHEQFCKYLLDKDDRFRKEILPFEGRNVAIWWDGCSTSAA